MQGTGQHEIENDVAARPGGDRADAAPEPSREARAFWRAANRLWVDPMSPTRGAEAARVVLDLHHSGASRVLAEVLRVDHWVPNSAWTVACFELGAASPAGVEQVGDVGVAIGALVGCSERSHVASELICTSPSGVQWSALLRTRRRVVLRLPSEETLAGPPDAVAATLRTWRRLLAEASVDQDADARRADPPSQEQSFASLWAREERTDPVRRTEQPEPTGETITEESLGRAMRSALAASVPYLERSLLDRLATELAGPHVPLGTGKVEIDLDRLADVLRSALDDVLVSRLAAVDQTLAPVRDEVQTLRRVTDDHLIHNDRAVSHLGDRVEDAAASVHRHVDGLADRVLATAATLDGLQAEVGALGTTVDDLARERSREEAAAEAHRDGIAARAERHRVTLATEAAGQTAAQLETVSQDLSALLRASGEVLADGRRHADRLVDHVDDQARQVVAESGARVEDAANRAVERIGERIEWAADALAERQARPLEQVGASVASLSSDVHRGIAALARSASNDRDALRVLVDLVSEVRDSSARSAGVLDSVRRFEVENNALLQGLLDRVHALELKARGPGS